MAAPAGCALVLSLGLIAALPGGPATAQTCDRSGCGLISCGDPARPAPASLWGELQPVDSNPLPLERDSTAFDEFTQNYSTFPWFTGVEAQNGYLVASLAYGLESWDLRTHPDRPDFLGRLSWGDFPVWVDSAEEKWPIQDVAMPAGVDTIAAVVGHAGIGLAIVDLADKTHPHLLYQSYKKNGEEVYATTLGGTPYAFLAASGGSPSGGVFAYDMSQASQFSHCSESAPADPVFCSGVYLGKIGTRSSVSFLHGVDNFIIFSSGSGSGFDVWNVADPRNPQMVLTALNDPPICGFDRRSTYGVAMWKDSANHYYVGLRTENYSCAQFRTINEARIYDVTCNLAGTCGALGSPIFTQELDSGTSRYFVTFSRSLTTPFLYFGSDDKCRGGSQREWLFDVTHPASAHDITPPTGYWGWYYRGGATGFNNEMPRRGKFYNEYFYRAALSILDIHRHTVNVPPAAAFSWAPGEIYPGTPVQFQDTSTAFPNSWTWTFSDLPVGAASPPKP
ncbi:MAG TPA: hypothetical protein VFE33_16250 [Thermoanaerobaculia bacterium]|nr:hypothetical protein [Thermoanaerobaculia bacterium]